MTDMVVVPKEVIDDAIRQLSWFRGRALKDGKQPQADWIETFRKKLQWCAFSADASAPPVGEGMREKVAEIIKQKVSGPHFTDPAFAVAMHQDRLIAADAILALLSSGEA